MLWHDQRSTFMVKMTSMTRSLPALLRQYRNKREWSLSIVADQSGTSAQHLSEIESGKVDARLSSIERIAKTLGLEVMLVPVEHVVAVRAHIKNGRSIQLLTHGERYEDE